MILLWVVLAIIAGALLGRLLGFMTVEFVMRPLVLIYQLGAAAFQALANWGRRLP